jgi:hypothetical protein
MTSNCSSRYQYAMYTFPCLSSVENKHTQQTGVYLNNLIRVTVEKNLHATITI